MIAEETVIVMKKTVQTLLVTAIALMLICAIWIQTGCAMAEELPATFQRFISDARWRDGTPWGTYQLPKLDPGQRWLGCSAYCLDFSQYCFHVDTPEDGTPFYDAREIQAGDVITIGNPFDGSGHWFVCLKRNGDALYVAEANYNSRVRIGWNYTIIDKTRLKQDNRPFNTGYHLLKPKTVRGLMLEAKKKKLIATWEEISGVTGYEVEYGLKKSFSGAKKKTVNDADSAMTTLRHLEIKKTYYVRIRSYVTFDGMKYYSGWSAAVKAKTK